ncbi:MAG: cytidylate kinase family protein [Candidatus Burarchaeum sp.]|nr:cytidylate kinase family protein [Candidatus Burarchaeum sp.]MDO8339385.1 cytidylate kinase family protein [Candidatus Burarchaeum sp.]
MTIICISGLTGSGKNAAGEALAKRLNLRLVSLTFKDDAKKRGISLMQLQGAADKDKKIDVDFDARVVNEASKGNCIVTTWLGPWMVKAADLRVWINAEENVRAARIAKRDGMGAKEALEHLRMRDNDNRARYKKYYGIGLDDHSNFDLEIDSGKLSPEEIAALIEKALRAKAKK